MRWSLIMASMTLFACGGGSGDDGDGDSGTTGDTGTTTTTGTATGTTSIIDFAVQVKGEQADHGCTSSVKALQMRQLPSRSQAA